MKHFFQYDLISIFHMKKMRMGNFDAYELFDGVYHCLRDSQVSCYASASASIYVPWSTTNAAAIMSSIEKLSKYFAIYPLSGLNMKHNILLDVTNKARELNQEYFFEMHSPPTLKDIQNRVSHFDKSLLCTNEVTDLLQMLNTRYGLDNIRYVCLKILGCHHESFSVTQQFEGFGMTEGGFFFPCFEKHDDYGKLVDAFQNDQVEIQNFASKSFDGNCSGASSSESVEIVHVTKKRNQNEFATYFDSVGSSSTDGNEIFSFSESGISDGCSVDDVRPVEEVLVNEPENDDVDILMQVSDEESKDEYDRNGM